MLSSSIQVQCFANSPQNDEFFHRNFSWCFSAYTLLVIVLRIKHMKRFEGHRCTRFTQMIRKKRVILFSLGNKTQGKRHRPPARKFSLHPMSAAGLTSFLAGPYCRKEKESSSSVSICVICGQYSAFFCFQSIDGRLLDQYSSKKNQEPTVFLCLFNCEL